MTNVQNGRLINRYTVVHFRRLSLRIFLEISENMFFEGNNGRAEWSVDPSMDRSPFLSFQTSSILE